MTLDEKNGDKPQLWTKDFILMSFANLLMAVGFYFLIPSLPVFLVKELKAPTSEVGSIIAFFTLSALLTRPFAGAYLDRIGRKRIYLSSFAMFMSLYVFYPMVHSLSGLLVIRFFHGIAWGALTTTSSTIVVDIIPQQRRGEGIAFFGMSMTIAMAIAPLLALVILGDGNYLACFMSALVIIFVGFILACFINYPKDNKHNNGKILTVENLVETRAVPVSLVHLFTMITYGGVVTFVTLYISEIGVGSAGAFFSMIAVGIGISRLFAGRIYDDRGPDGLTFAGYFIMFLGFLILALFKNSYGFLIAGFVIGAGNGIVWPTFQAMVNSVVERNRRGAANSTLFTATDIGIGLGSVLIGIIADHVSFSFAYLLCSVLLILCLAYYRIYVSGHYKRRRLFE